MRRPKARSPPLGELQSQGPSQNPNDVSDDDMIRPLNKGEIPDILLAHIENCPVCSKGGVLSALDILQCILSEVNRTLEDLQCTIGEVDVSEGELEDE